MPRRWRWGLQTGGCPNTSPSACVCTTLSPTAEDEEQSYFHSKLTRHFDSTLLCSVLQTDSQTRSGGTQASVWPFSSPTCVLFCSDYSRCGLSSKSPAWQKMSPGSQSLHRATESHRRKEQVRAPTPTDEYVKEVWKLQESSLTSFFLPREKHT